MHYHDFTVTYRIDDAMLSRIEKISKRFGEDVSTPERMFDFIMNFGSKHDIDDKVSFFERKFSID